MPVIWVGILKNNAGHCSAGMRWGGEGQIGQRRMEQRDTSQKTVKPRFHSIPPVCTSLFPSLFSFSSLSLFSHQAWRQTALTWRDPECSWCCFEFLLPFTHAPSSAYRTVVWQLQSGKRKADRLNFLNYKLVSTTERGQYTLKLPKN